MGQQKPFILIVEDDRALRDVVSRHLRAVGYMVLEAGDFEEAVNQMSIRPDLMIVDINLPDSNGWEVMKWLGTLTRPVPVVVMSGVVTPGPRELERSGARAFLAKPFPISDLIKLARRYAPLPVMEKHELPR